MTIKYCQDRIVEIDNAIVGIARDSDKVTHMKDLCHIRELRGERRAMVRAIQTYQPRETN